MRLDNETQTRANLQNWLTNSVQARNYKSIATILEIETSDVTAQNGSFLDAKGHLILEQRITKKLLNLSSN